MIHKHLAHLTRERVQPVLLEWKYQAIPNDVMTLVNAWTNHVDQAAEVSTRVRAYLLWTRQTPMTTSSVIATTTSTSFDTADVVFPDERSPKG